MENSKFGLSAYFCRELKFIAILLSKLKYLLRIKGVDSDFTQNFWEKLGGISVNDTFQRDPAEMRTFRNCHLPVNNSSEVSHQKVSLTGQWQFSSRPCCNVHL